MQQTACSYVLSFVAQYASCLLWHVESAWTFFNVLAATKLCRNLSMIQAGMKPPTRGAMGMRLTGLAAALLPAIALWFLCGLQ
jgi:hypothetical protein